MRFLRSFFFFLIVFFIILIDLPENLRFNFEFLNQKIDFTINPLKIDTQIFGLKIRKDFKTQLGLDLKGGSQLVFEADTSRIKKEDLEDALNSARDIIEKRVNFFGVSEPQIQTLKSQGKYRISVDLPGITDLSSAIELIGQTAQLSFKEETPIKDQKEATQTPIFLRLTKDTELTGRQIKKAQLTFDSQTGKPQVALIFTDEGAKLFSKITERNVGKPLAIYLDQFLLSTPVVQQKIEGGNAVITGDFTVDEAKKLVIAINSGALPLPMKIVEHKNIGPTLGASEVRKSFYAGLFGLFLVILFMVLYYGKLGVIASLALLIYGALSLAIFRAIPVVLTLPGVTGFILSIGMAVDSNILIFERIKEELRKGKSFEIAFNLGFGRAIDAIKDANITTLIVAFILFNPLNWEFLPQFGMVRGFALTLAIGVITSLFTGVVITKRLIKFFYKLR